MSGSSSQLGNDLHAGHGGLQPGDTNTLKMLGMLVGSLLVVMFAFIGLSLIF